jgi:Cu+-exporting ATPase
MHRHLNMWTLIGIGTGAAFSFSLVATLFPDFFPSSYSAMGRVGFTTKQQMSLFH